MVSDGNEKRLNHIPIRFVDDENEGVSSAAVDPADMDRIDPDSDEKFPTDTDLDSEDDSVEIDVSEALNG